MFSCTVALSGRTYVACSALLLGQYLVPNSRIIAVPSSTSHSWREMSDGLEQIQLDNPGKRIAHVREEPLGHCGRLVLARACGLGGTVGCRRICHFLFSQLLKEPGILEYLVDG